MGLKDKLLSALGQGMDATRDFAGKAAGVTKDFAGKAADKAKAGGRIAKLTMDIAKEKEDMKKTFVEIGKLYYDTHKDSPDGAIQTDRPQHPLPRLLQRQSLEHESGARQPRSPAHAQQDGHPRQHARTGSRKCQRT